MLVYENGIFFYQFIALHSLLVLFVVYFENLVGISVSIITRKASFLCLSKYTHTHTHIFSNLPTAYAYACQLISSTLSISLSLLFLHNCKSTNILKAEGFFFRFSNFSFKLIFFYCSFRWRILTLKLTNNLECI